MVLHQVAHFIKNRVSQFHQARQAYLQGGL